MDPEDKDIKETTEIARKKLELPTEALDAKAAVDKEWEKLEKMPAWQMTKVKSKKEVIREAQQERRTVHFCHADGHLSYQECGVRTEVSENKGKIVLRGTEQGSSASQTTAAEAMDVIARQPGCAGQAADAVSTYTKVRMGDPPKLLKIPKSECADIWMRLPRHKWRKSKSNIEDPVVLLERHFYGHPLPRFLCERQFEEVLLGLGWGKVPNWECLLVCRKQGLLSSVYVDDIKMARKKL